MAGLAVRGGRGITMTEAARVFNRDPSSLTPGAARLRGKLNGDEGDRQGRAKVKAGF